MTASTNPTERQEMGGTEKGAQIPRAQRGPRRKPAKVRGIFERPKGSDLWWVRYTAADGREHREKAGTRGMALLLLAKRRSQRLAGVKLPETLRGAPATFAEIAAAGLEWSKQHKSSWAGDVGRLRQACGVLGARPAAEITPQELERGLRKLAEDHGWKPATFNRVKNVVSMCYRLAVANGAVNVNPARLVRQMRSDNVRLRFLSPEEETRLRAVIAAECPQHMPELDLALNTGMRAGEQFGLTWPDVDFELGLIRLGQTKNGRERYIRLNAPATAALRQLRRTSAGAGPVFINAVTPGRYHGKPRATARNWFERAVKRAGLEGVVWHSLRHTFCSRLAMAGVDIATVGQLAGHRTLQTTMRYAHLSPEHQQEAVERLARFAAVPTGTRTGTGDSGESGESAQVLAVQ